MKKIYGKIYDVLPEERAVRIEARNKLKILFMSRKTFKDFGPYLVNKPYIFVYISEEPKKQGLYKGYEVVSFIKIIQNNINKPKIFYDLSAIRRGVKSLLDRVEYKLFLDLEFTLPPYNQRTKHIPEIIQYGIILEDAEGDIILDDSSLVMTKKKRSLNTRTLKFLSKDKADFESACTYYDFYNLLKDCIEKYDVKIIAWGKNDILILEKSFELHQVLPLDFRSRYLNLMQVIKNYYNQKNDLGLFTTYQQMSNHEIEIQQHDAFEDALLTREIYHMFKNNINKDE